MTSSARPRVAYTRAPSGEVATVAGAPRSVARPATARVPRSIAVTPRPAATYAREPSAAVATACARPGSATRAVIGVRRTSSSAASGRSAAIDDDARVGGCGGEERARQRVSAVRMDSLEPGGVAGLRRSRRARANVNGGWVGAGLGGVVGSWQ